MREAAPGFKLRVLLAQALFAWYGGRPRRSEAPQRRQPQGCDRQRDRAYGDVRAADDQQAFHSRSFGGSFDCALEFALC
jgi:hypothetical protein